MAGWDGKAACRKSVPGRYGGSGPSCFFRSGFNFTSPFSEQFFITQIVLVNGGVGWKSGLPEIGSGQVWRLWSTFFLHTRWNHLVGNVLWFAPFWNFIQ